MTDPSKLPPDFVVGRLTFASQRDQRDGKPQLTLLLDAVPRAMIGRRGSHFRPEKSNSGNRLLDLRVCRVRHPKEVKLQKSKFELRLQHDDRRWLLNSMQLGWRQEPVYIQLFNELVAVYRPGFVPEKVRHMSMRG